MMKPEESVGFLITDVARMLRRNFNRRAQGLGLSQSQWQALAHISRQQGINQVTLARNLELQPMTVARLIDKLQEQGYVARHPDPADRRAFRLYLTERAEPLLDRIWQLAGETKAEALQGLSDDERKRLLKSLGRMRQNLLDVECRNEQGQQQNKKELSHVD